MIEASGARIPTHVPYLTSLPLSLRVCVAFGRVVVVAGRGGPVGMGGGVECPVRQIDRLQRIRQRCGLERIRSKPSGPHPMLHDVTYARVVQLHRQEGLRSDRVARLLVRSDGWRPAEIAALRHAGRLEHGDGITALALYLDGFNAIATAVAAGRGQSVFEVVFTDSGGFRRLLFGNETAVGTSERLFCGVPLHLSPTIGAGTLT